MLRPINTMMYADGACEARSRQEEEDDAWPSLTTTNAEIVHNPHLPSGWRRAEPMALSLLLHDTRHRVRRRFAPSTPSRSPHTSSYLWDGALRVEAPLLQFLTLQSTIGHPLPCETFSPHIVTRLGHGFHVSDDSGKHVAGPQALTRR